MNGKSKRLLRDLCLIFALLAVGLSVFAFSRLLSSPGERVVIYRDGKPVTELSLSEDCSYTLPGGKNTVVIEDGRVRMEHADCPDGLCVRMGNIRNKGEKIVCLPNGVIIEVTGGTEEEILPTG